MIRLGPQAHPEIHSPAEFAVRAELAVRVGPLKRFGLIVSVLAGLIGMHPSVAAAAGPFDGWSFNGVTVTTDGASLAPDSDSLSCVAGDVDGLQPGYDAVSGLCRATDIASQYAGGDFVYGTMTSPVIDPGQSSTELLGSWDAVTPAGTWIELHMRVLQAAGWSGWYALPVWASDPQTLNRHSGNGQKDASAKVDTDSLVMAPGQPASEYQLEATLFSQSPDLTPTVRLVQAALSPAPQSPAADHSAWGADLPVPQRSQMLPAYSGLGFGGGGEAWCSPTSTSMIMAYWGNMLHLPQLVLPVPAVAAGSYDYVYQGTGNWSFNTAFASSYGLTAYVNRFSSFDQIEPWISASVPIVISISFQAGQLDGAPIPSSPGHLVVVRGFTSNGDVIVNDPAAANDPAVRTVYSRAQLETIWQRHGGVAYVMYPPGWAIPN